MLISGEGVQITRTPAVVVWLTRNMLTVEGKGSNPARRKGATQRWSRARETMGKYTSSVKQ